MVVRTWGVKNFDDLDVMFRVASRLTTQGNLDEIDHDTPPDTSQALLVPRYCYESLCIFMTNGNNCESQVPLSPPCWAWPILAAKRSHSKAHIKTTSPGLCHTCMHELGIVSSYKLSRTIRFKPNYLTRRYWLFNWLYRSRNQLLSIQISRVDAYPVLSLLNTTKQRHCDHTMRPLNHSITSREITVTAPMTRSPPPYTPEFYPITAQRPARSRLWNCSIPSLPITAPFFQQYIARHNSTYPNKQYQRLRGRTVKANESPYRVIVNSLDSYNSIGDSQGSWCKSGCGWYFLHFWGFYFLLHKSGWFNLHAKRFEHPFAYPVSGDSNHEAVCCAFSLKVCSTPQPP